MTPACRLLTNPQQFMYVNTLHALNRFVYDITSTSLSLSIAIG